MLARADVRGGTGLATGKNSLVEADSRRRGVDVRVEEVMTDVDAEAGAKSRPGSACENSAYIKSQARHFQGWARA